MHASLRANQFLVKEHIGFLEPANHYDIFDPDTGQKLLQCREPNLGLFGALRQTQYKRMTPFDLQVSALDGRSVLSVRRGISVLASHVEVLDENRRVVGRFREKQFSVGGKFDVRTPDGCSAGTLVGKWTTWDFRFMRGDRALATVAKRWAGMAKQMFTTADNYVLSINPDVPPDDPVRRLLLGAVLCIDMVMKE